MAIFGMVALYALLSVAVLMVLFAVIAAFAKDMKADGAPETLKRRVDRLEEEVRWVREVQELLSTEEQSK